MKVKFLKSALLCGLLVLGGLTGCGPKGNPEGVYDVTYKNWNGEVLYVDKVEEGEASVYKGETPTKPQDESFKYTFKEWDKEFELQSVMEDITTNAVFDKVPLGVDNEYDKSVKAWSQPGHIYFHYFRSTATKPEDYNDWCLWMWQKSPVDSEGTLWGATEEEMGGKILPLSSSWMETIPGSGKPEDQAGRVMDIDLTLEQEHKMLSGKTRQEVSLSTAKTIGFLVAQKSSMDGGDHWKSDGGANTYLRGLDQELKKNGGWAHIYARQGNVGDAKFYYSTTTVENPTLTDNTGKYNSKSDINSSESKYDVSPTSKSFSNLGVGYQIFVPSFRDSNNDGIGDIQGIIDALPYLKDLGVEVLWLTPVQQSESYHGYDITDFYRIDPKFGGEDDPDGKYRELIYKAHESGMKVLMDFVVNHTAKNNVWFKKSQRAEVGTDEFGNKINYRDLYHWKLGTDKVKKYNKETKQYDLVTVAKHGDWYQDGETNYYYYGKFGSNMAELNYDCQATRNLVTSMALYWLGFGVDGFRLDAVKHIYMKDEVDDTGSDAVVTDVGKKVYYDEEMGQKVTKYYDYSSDLTKNVNFWKEFANRLKSVYPECFLVGENFDGWGNRIAQYYQALDSQFDFANFFHIPTDLYVLDEGGAQTMSGKHFKETAMRFEATDSETLSPKDVPPYKVEGGKRSDFINGAFTSNHDTPRLINNLNGVPGINPDTKDKESVPAAKVTGTPTEINRAKVGAAITMLKPGLSWIYYGDEIGMSGNTDQHIIKYEYENNLDIWYRQPFKWQDTKLVPTPKFDKYTIEWDSHNAELLSAEEQASNESTNDMLDFFKELTKVKTTILKGARFNAEQIDQRYNGMPDGATKDLVIIKVNTAKGGRTIYVNSGAHNLSFDIHENVLAHLNGATASGHIPAYGVLVTGA